MCTSLTDEGTGAELTFYKKLYEDELSDYGFEIEFLY